MIRDRDPERSLLDAYVEGRLDEDARRRDATGGEPRPRGSANFVSRSESLVRGDASASVASFRGAEDGTA